MAASPRGAVHLASPRDAVHRGTSGPPLRALVMTVRRPAARIGRCRPGCSPSRTPPTLGTVRADRPLLVTLFTGPRVGPAPRVADPAGLCLPRAEVWSTPKVTADVGRVVRGCPGGMSGSVSARPGRPSGIGSAAAWPGPPWSWNGWVGRVVVHAVTAGRGPVLPPRGVARPPGSRNDPGPVAVTSPGRPSSLPGRVLDPPFTIRASASPCSACWRVPRAKGF